MIHVIDQQYIVRNDHILSGEPIIGGTRTPVRAIVELWRLGLPPEEIPVRLPHLTMAQVFAALSYYSDHQAEIHEYIERNHIPEALVGSKLEFKAGEQAVY
jgi:uncharacterized protein (DUF433 family)